MNLQSNDRSHEALTVGSLNVLGDLNNGVISSIHTHLQSSDAQQLKIIADIEKLHENISADGVITANEKQILKKEVGIIETEYPIILQKAQNANKNESDINSFKIAFKALRDYLFVELKIFDDMSEALEVDREVFNEKFADYYKSRAVLQINKDGTTKFLPSLEIAGDHENQIGTFQGMLYRWTGGKWELLNAVMPRNPICYYDMAGIQPKIICQHGYLESTGKYGIKTLCDLSAYKGKTIKITVSGYRKGDGGFPELYVYDAAWNFGWSSGGNLNSVSEKTMSDIIILPAAYDHLYCTLYHIPGDKMNNTAVMTHCTIETVETQPIIDSSGNGIHAKVSGNVAKVKDDKLGAVLKFDKGIIESSPRDFIGLGKKWSHSRWIKIDKNKLDKNTNPRLWSYGLFDYCFVDIAANNGTVSNASMITYKNDKNYTYASISKDDLLNNEWHNLIVCNDVQTTYAKKIIYLDGKKIAEDIKVGDFSNFTSSPSYHTDMASRTNYTNGSLANLIFFERLLTDQEALWLYQNPQYPVKNYTLADWQLDPENPDSNIKNLTPKYLGVTETVPDTRVVTITKGERLGFVDANPGDWVLMGKTIGGWKVGVCYRWSGTQWLNLEPEVNYAEYYHACLVHMFEIEELKQQTGHFGALFTKVLVAQKALIDELKANKSHIIDLATDKTFAEHLVAQQLKIDTIKGDEHNDFEAWFDASKGLQINNEGKTIFKVSPNGDVFMKSGKLIIPVLTSDPSDAKIGEIWLRSDL